jgi:uncharacterized damage-inducible protein DinB
VDVLQPLRRLLAYDERANREVLAVLAAATPPPERALKIFAHVLACEWLWLERLRRQRFKVVVWPDSSLATCREQLADLPKAWQLFFDTLDPRRLAEPVNYTNSKGEAWSNTIEDILMHVVLHSAYHRGQIALVLRDAGYQPPETDFIHCVRQGLIEV